MGTVVRRLDVQERLSPASDLPDHLAKTAHLADPHVGVRARGKPG